MILRSAGGALLVVSVTPPVMLDEGIEDVALGGIAGDCLFIFVMTIVTSIPIGVTFVDSSVELRVFVFFSSLVLLGFPRKSKFNQEIQEKSKEKSQIHSSGDNW